MLIAHLADLHLGYRAYHRLAPGGLNARELDVTQAFRAALDATIALRPDLVLVAGDVFHTIRPSNTAIAEGFRQFARLAAALPGTPVVVCITLSKAGPDSILIDPFCGGASTLIAAKEMGVSGVAYEINTKTAELARNRLETISSQEPQ